VKPQTLVIPIDLAEAVA